MMMSTRTITCSVALICCLVIFLPSDVDARGFGFGVRGGWLWPKPSVRDDVSFRVDGQLGLIGGGSVTYGFTDAVGLQLDVLYATKRFSSEGFPTEGRVVSTWIDAPVLLAISLSRGERFRPVLIGGAQFGFKVDATREFKGADQDIGDQLKDSDVGVVFGGRVNLLPNRDHLTVEGRIQWGLVNLDETNWYEIKSRSVIVLFGYEF